ncbi:hypothetical protein DIPPA_20301 [Diplonema papillatum]|nr:hypothetical protein DIPPA_20301 [Diplonema papillatum]
MPDIQNPSSPSSPEFKGEQRETKLRVILDGYRSVLQGPARVQEVLGDMPFNAKAYLLYVLLADAVSISYPFWHNSPDRVAFRTIIVVCLAFHYAAAFHAVYTQNEFTLSACVLFSLVMCSFLTYDWQEKVTGYSFGVWVVIVQWASAAILVVLSVNVYRTMEDFGWKPYRELGTLPDKLAVHAAYRKFTALLFLDLFTSCLVGILSLVLVSWPNWLTALCVAFSLTLPFVAGLPMKKIVKNEWHELLRVLWGLYAFGGVVMAIVLVYSVLNATGHMEHSRLHEKKFPVSFTLITAASCGLALRAAMLGSVWYVAVIGKGHLKQLAIARKLQRDSYANSYGTIGSSTRYDYHYRIVPDAIADQSISSATRTRGASKEVESGRPPSRIPSTDCFHSSFSQDPSFCAAMPDNESRLGPVPIIAAKSVALQND